MTTAVLPDVTEITLEDIAPGCEFYPNGGNDLCVYHAEWFISWSCGCVKLYCTDHKEFILNHEWITCINIHKEFKITPKNVERL